MTRALTPLKSYGTERVPREGGAVLASNHLSWLDPPALGTICPRRARHWPGLAGMREGARAPAVAGGRVVWVGDSGGAFSPDAARMLYLKASSTARKVRRISVLPRLGQDSLPTVLLVRY